MVQERLDRTGLALGIGTYFLWGLFPLYFRALEHVGAEEIVAHRILWSVLLLAGILSWRKKGPTLRRVARDMRVVLMLSVTALLISTNWLVYIWAITHGHVLEASLGYYLNPLVNILLGTLVLRERLSLGQCVAVGLAATGVATLAMGAASGVWISLTLAATFSLYGFVRKVIPAEPVEGLTIETLLLAPFALAWLTLLQVHGTADFGQDRITDFLLILSGAVTALPLLMFNAAAKSLPYSTMGFLQFVSPTLQFAIGLMFGEKMTLAHAICFAAIWTAVGVFAAAGLRASRAAARERLTAS